MVGLTAYFVFYNGERPHHSLGHQTPESCIGLRSVAGR